MNHTFVNRLIGKDVVSVAPLIIYMSAVEKKRPSSYNKIIRKNICSGQIGVYIWRNHETNEILYIGMAGKVNQKGKKNSHDLRKRLVASRRKNNRGKDISTSDYLLKIMRENKINAIKIQVFYTKIKVAPSYLEAVLLQSYWKKSKYMSLPKFNASF
jgi:hypothetical protein